MIRENALSIRELTVGGLFAALITAGAWVKITLPTQPLPMHFTLQWFFVLLAGLLLNKKLAGASVAVYLFLGLMGVPVFASGGGPSYIARPTFGYLLGFFAAAYVMAWLSERVQPAGFLKLFGISMAGFCLYYGIGILYFFIICRFFIAREVTWQILFINCFLLTAGGDFALCLAAVSVAAKLRGIVKKTLYMP
ncbi:MAG: biotin transporter BioY [Lachnospiraceae bacterium]|jgi:biotin transport system substrate-specific component|nr:biotin transporter BioY [Lachnospiraceae bacterium]